MRRRTFLGGVALVPLGLSACGSDGDDPAPADTAPPDEGSGGADGSEDTGGPPAWDPESVAEDTTHFPLGVQAGTATDHGALLWGFREAGDSGPTTLMVWDPDRTVLVERAVTPVEGYINESVDGLSADTQYRYAFFTGAGAGDQGWTGRSIAGRFRTAFASGTLKPVVLAATSCTKDWHAPYTSLEIAAKHDLHAFCHLGDISYNDLATTREEYRELWRQTLMDPGYRALLPSCGTYITWDDHEIADDAKRYSLPPEHLEAAIESFFETLPVPRREDDTFWASYRWGASVEIFVLDCRRERQPETAGTDNPIYISKAQMEWLKQALSDSPCRFKVMMNSVPIAALPPVWPTEDSWMGYAGQRDELLDHITDNDIDGVWFLSGDYHMGTVNRVETTGPRADLWEIMAGPGASSPNPLLGAVELAPELAPDYVPAEQFDYYSTKHAATIITFDPVAETVHVIFLDSKTEEVLYEHTYG